MSSSVTRRSVAAYSDSFSISVEIRATSAASSSTRASSSTGPIFSARSRASSSAIFLARAEYAARTQPVSLRRNGTPNPLDLRFIVAVKLVTAAIKNQNHSRRRIFQIGADRRRSLALPVSRFGRAASALPAQITRRDANKENDRASSITVLEILDAQVVAGDALFTVLFGQHALHQRTTTAVARPTFRSKKQICR